MNITENIERLVGALARIYVQEGKATEVAVLANASVSITRTEYEYECELSRYLVSLKVPSHLFTQILDQHKELEGSFLERLRIVARVCPGEIIDGVVIGTELPKADEWRAGAKAWLRGEGVTNQGRARSERIAPKMSDGLLFRSVPEIELYRALKALGVAFAPLPVFVRGGNTYRRIEPDFVIIKDGITMVVEVDGDEFHPESPQEAHGRLTMLTHEGVHVERVNASECETPDKARSCAAKILRVIEKLKTNK